MIWMYVLLFAVAGAAFGYGVGAIRSGVTLIGTLIGLAAAPVLGHWFEPIFIRTAAGSPMWQYILPPFSAFLVVFFLAMAIGFAARFPIFLHFKHNEEDVTREGFLRLDQAGGTFFGLLIGLVLFFTFGRLGYAGGTIAAATSAETDPSGLVKWAAGFRRSLEGTGFDRAFAALDKTPPAVYDITEMLGILYENPKAHARLRDYPPYMKLADMTEFKEIAGDTAFQQLLSQKQGFTPVLENGRTQGLIGNSEITAELIKTDLADLKKYLETGDSPIYSDEKYRIVGRWRVDANAVIRNAARLNENLTPDQFKKLRAGLTALLSKAQLVVYPDGRLIFSGGSSEAPAEPVAEAAAATSALDPALAARYGIRPGARPGGVAAAPPKPAANEPKLPKLELNGDGTWTASSGKFVVTSKQKGQETAVEASVDEKGRLLISFPQLKTPLVLVRTS